jgi:putative ABC transport system permease protein
MGIFNELAKVRRSAALAVRSLWLHKLRAFLSVLGIIIGTGSVIAMMSFAKGNMQDTLDDIKRQGATNIIVASVKPSDDATSARRTMIAAYGLTMTDYECFQTIPHIVRWVPMRKFPQEFRRFERMHTGKLVGTTPEYPEITKIELTAGRFFNPDDDLHKENVAVVGAWVADTLFPFDDPLDQTIVMRGQDYRVIGVLKERTAAGSGQTAEDFNNYVYIPFSTCLGRFGETIFIRTSGSRSGEKVELNQVTMTVSDIDKVRPTGDLIREMLERRHVRKDWEVNVPLDRLEAAERAQARDTLLMGAIAGISLLVGGIGIMNIMLATVTERTREIGIRRALGAKRRDITAQFLVEAVVQTTVGGLLGVATGLCVAGLGPIVWHWVFGSKLPALIHVPAIFLSLFVSVGVGVVFGLYPAWRAANLDPIEALRHD